MEPRDMMRSEGERGSRPAASQPGLPAAGSPGDQRRLGLWSSPPPRGAAAARLSPSLQTLRQRAAASSRPLPAAPPPAPEAVLGGGPSGPRARRLSLAPMAARWPAASASGPLTGAGPGMHAEGGATASHGGRGD